MRGFYLAYRLFGWPLIAFVFRLLACFAPKVREGLEARSRLPSGANPWATGLSKPGALWIHCSSGEFEYAKPVITLLKKEDPSRSILVTYFSTSYRKAVSSFPGVDLVSPLPWDTPRALKEFLNHHKPSQLLVARTDVWPEMARQARKAKLPSLLFSATLTAQSGRARGLGRWASRATFSNLNTIFAVSDEDTSVFESLGLRETQIVKAGDTRYDQVLARLSTPKPVKESLFTSNSPTVVCGSTWPEDEAILIPALAALSKASALSESQRPKFVLVPHEATPEHLAAIEAQLQDQGLTSVRYTQTDSWTEGVLLIDTMGILAELYLKADFAFVGGSFKKNIHSVMEPLAAGCLTLVGPKHANNREALALKEVTLAELNSNLPKTLTAVQPFETSEQLESLLMAALKLPLPDLKAAIRGEIEARTGASRLVVDWIKSH